MPGLTKEQKMAQLTNAETIVKELRKDLGLSTSESGAGEDVVATAANRDQNAEVWDRLSPAEKVHLFTNDRERWNELAAAKEQEGVRKLLGGGR